MLLNNQYKYKENERPEIIYANGDTGIIKEQINNGFESSYIVELTRNKTNVIVDRLIRHNTKVSEPSDEEKASILEKYDYEVEKVNVGGQWYWSLGYVDYFPMSVAYASTVHKSQGLSLDRVQIDMRDYFFKNPAMLYVAMSRCRTLEGLRIVGNPSLMKIRCKIDERVKEFI